MNASTEFKRFRLAFNLIGRSLLTMRLTFPVFPFKLGLLPYLSGKRLKRLMKNNSDPFVSIEKLDYRGVCCYLFTPKKSLRSKKDGVVLYLHGGAFTMGAVGTYADLMSKLARDSDLPVLFVCYSLAPSNPYPEASMECLTVYEELLRQGVSPDRIVVGGESAGGNLTGSLMHRLSATSTPKPAGIFLESPFLDLTFSGNSFKTNWRSEIILPLFPPIPKLWKWWLGILYVGGAAEIESPFVSPLFGEFGDWPPVSICYSQVEMLRDDAVRFIEKVEAAGVEVSSLALDYTPHANMVYLNMYKETKLSHDHHVQFIRKLLHNPN